MSRGLPDDANVKGYGDVSKADDMSELAIRLGSSLAYDRRGSVLYIDAFKHGAESWTVERATVAEQPTLSADYTIVDGAALLLATTGAAIQEVEGYKDLPLFTDAVYGIFAMVSLAAGTPYLYLRGQVYDGTNVWDYAVRISAGSATLEYRDGDGAWQTLSTSINSFSNEASFHALGIVFDIENDSWVQVTLDGVTYDLTDLSGHDVLNGTAPRLRVSVSVTSDGSTAATGIIDSIGLVQNPTIAD